MTNYYLISFVVISLMLLSYLLGSNHNETTNLEAEVIKTDGNEVVCYESDLFGFLCSRVYSTAYFYVERAFSFLSLITVILGGVFVLHTFIRGDM